MAEMTLVLIKPDAVQRGLVGEILGRFERKGFKIECLRTSKPTRNFLELHYREHVGKGFFEGLINMMMAGPLVSLVLSGPSVISGVRTMMGATNCKDALPGTIRGDLATHAPFNLVHGSDSQTAALSEIQLWFTEFYLEQQRKDRANPSLSLSDALKEQPAVQK